MIFDYFWWKPQIFLTPLESPGMLSQRSASKSWGRFDGETSCLGGGWAKDSWNLGSSSWSFWVKVLETTTMCDFSGDVEKISNLQPVQAN